MKKVKIMKLKNSIFRILIFTFVMGIFFVAMAFAKTTKSYKEWYKDKFGFYPDGGVESWKYDPVYSEYLNEIGETGYNNDVDGDPIPPKPAPRYDDRYYPKPEDLYWSGRSARWSVEGYASKYQVALFRDGNKVTTKTTTSRSYSFASYMSRGNNEYFFQVRAYNKNSGWWSDWEESDSYVVNNDDHYNPNNNIPYNPGPGVIQPIVINNQPPVSETVRGQWFMQNNKWYFEYENGTLASNTWLKLNGKWFYFNPDSSMAVGWLTLNGKTYYLNPDGSMLTGTVIFDGITHFFGEDGAMVY